MMQSMRALARLPILSSKATGSIPAISRRHSSSQKSMGVLARTPICAARSIPAISTRHFSSPSLEKEQEVKFLGYDRHQFVQIAESACPFIRYVIIYQCGGNNVLSITFVMYCVLLVPSSGTGLMCPVGIEGMCYLCVALLHQISTT